MRNRNKYNAKPCIIDGYKFPSTAEGNCYLLLKRYQSSGILKDIEVHVTTKLVAGITHKTDFRVFNIKEDHLEWIEFKGMETDRWRLVKRLWKVFGPGPLKVYKAKSNIILLDEIILPDMTFKAKPMYCEICSKLLN